MLNFTYEDDIKIKNKHFAGISRTYYLPIQTISRPPQSRETIPLNLKIMRVYKNCLQGLTFLLQAYFEKSLISNNENRKYSNYMKIHVYETPVAAVLASLSFA
jgi:hypothetical protein